MKRLVLNGSPRGAASNSRTIIAWMVEGMAEAGAQAPEVLDLARTRDLPRQRQAFLDADEAVLVFPLYTDSVPGIVKNFLDSLADAPRDRLTGKRIAFVIHSGFPESFQSEPVASYMERLSGRLGMVHCGTAIKAGSEGFRMMPARMTRKPHELVAALGKSLVEAGRFDAEAREKLARPRRSGLFRRLLLSLMAIFGVTNMYWDWMLKKNGAFEKRFDQPYAYALGTHENPRR